MNHHQNQKPSASNKKLRKFFAFVFFWAYSTGQQIIIDMPQIKKSYFRENLCAEHGIKDG